MVMHTPSRSVHVGVLAARVPGRQRGVALLSAMVIVTLVATLSASMVWQQWRAVQVESAERVRTQASWVLSGALDWARLILREDQRSGGVDHLGEPWAVPLAEARLSTFLAADASNNAAEDDTTPEAFLSGKVDDAASRYNLRNLLDGDGKIVPAELAVLRRLCEFAGLSPALADGIADSWRRGSLAVQATQLDDADALVALGGPDGLARAPLLPATADQLTWLGLDAGTVERLRPFVTVLPDATKVNVNTAPREVIAAVVEGLDLGRAARVVQVRQRTPLRVTDDLNAILGASNWDFSRLAVTSDYFEVRGRLRYEDNVIEQRHLVQRSGGDVLVRNQSRFSGLDLSGGAPPR